MRKASLYTKKAVLEVMETKSIKVKKGYTIKRGMIKVRVATLDKENHKEIVMILSPEEATKVAYQIKGLIKKEKGKIKSIFHKVEEKKMSTSLELEKWTKGVAVIITRNNGETIKINIPLDKWNAVYLADFLSHLSMEMSYITSEKTEEEPKETKEENPENPEEEPDTDIEDILDEF